MLFAERHHHPRWSDNSWHISVCQLCFADQHYSPRQGNQHQSLYFPGLHFAERGYSLGQFKVNRSVGLPVLPFAGQYIYEGGDTPLIRRVRRRIHRLHLHHLQTVRAEGMRRGVPPSRCMEEIHHHRRDITNKRGAETPLFFCLLPKFKEKRLQRKQMNFGVSFCVMQKFNYAI